MDASTEIANLLRIGVTSRQSFCSLLLTWDGSKISTTRKRTHRLKYFIGMAHAMVYAFYLLCQLGASFSKTKSVETSLSEYVDFLWVLLWTLYYVWAVVTYFNYCEKSPELATFLNGLPQINRLISYEFQDDEERTVSLPPHICNVLWLIVFGMNSMCVGFSLCSGFMSVMLIDKPEFISSILIPSSGEFGWSFLILFYFFEVYSVGVTVGSISFLSMYQSFYMALFCNSIQCLRQNNYISPAEKLSSYRRLQIFNICFNNTHTSLIFLTNVFTFFVATIGTFFGAMRFHFVSSIFEYMLFPFANVCLIIVFTVLMYGSASVHSAACKLLLALQRNYQGTRQPNKRIVTRQLRQLSPIGVKLGTFGYIKKSSMFLAYGALSNYSASLLVALPYKYFQ